MNKVRYKGSIKRRLTLIILFVTFLVGSVGYGSFSYRYLQDQQQRTIQFARAMSLSFSQDFAKLILLNKVSTAADISSKLTSFPHLKSMVLYTVDSKPIYQFSRDNTSFTADLLPQKAQREVVFQEGSLLHLYTDAMYQGTLLGHVQLTFNIETIEDVLKRDIKFLVLSLLLMFLFSYLLASLFSKRFTRPILELVSSLEKIDVVDSLKQRFSTKEDNEFGKLYDEVNTMLERIESSQEKQRIAATAFETQSGMTIADAEQNILQINSAFTEITGYEPDEVIGKNPSILSSGLHEESYYRKMYEDLDVYHYWSGEIYNRHKDGTIYPEHLTIQAVLDERGEIIYYVASFTDLTLQKETEEKLHYLTQYDTLTGLVNRELLKQSLQQHLDKRESESWGALLCFDIQDFKMINDAYGHTSGDLLLQEIANRLRDDFRDSELIGRFSGDEFVLWFSAVGDDKESASMQGEVLAQQLVTTIQKPFSINEKIIHPICYVGIALYNSDAADSGTILQQADGALHLAKKKQDRCLAFFDEQIEQKLLSHFDMYAQLLVAIEEEQFELYYQLQYNEEAEPYGAEALIRWQHPTKGMISPFEFIPVAERTGLIISLGKWILESACEQLALWKKSHATAHWCLAVNISAKQFSQDDFVQDVKAVIQKNDIESSALKLELTESILVDDIDSTRQKMKQLSEVGVSLSLDDFGTGYSSLQYLRILPLDQVKIDQSFVRNMLASKKDVAIIKSVLLLADAFELEVIAEGVETKEHYLFLKELGCRYFQGYYFARPQKSSDIVM